MTTRPQIQHPTELGQPWEHPFARRPIITTPWTTDADVADLWLPVNPVPLERARVVTRIDHHGNRRTRGITPPTTSAFYDQLRWTWNQLPKPQPHYPATTTLEITIELWRNLPRPRSQRGDLSNLVKAIEDALNGLAWHDDRQINTLHATIRHAGRTTPGAIHLTITPQETNTP